MAKDNNSESGGKKPFRERLQELRRGNRLVRVLTNSYLLITLAFLVIVVFLDANNVLRWGRYHMELKEQKRTIRQYENDIRTTEKKLKELSSNKDSLETFAREEYYFHEEDEDIFIVE